MIKRLYSIILLFSIISGIFTGCNNKPENTFSLWSLPNTVKVMKNDNGSAFKIPEIGIDIAREEYEGGQFIITPDVAITSFDVSASNLVHANGKDTIPASNISILVQKYINVTTKSNNASELKLGWYPDALIPLKNYKEKNEDKIAAKENQGITLNIQAPAKSVAGDYESTVTVTANNIKKTIIFKVKVFDFTISKETHLKSSVYIRREWLMNGELDDSEEMANTYYDFAAKYRLAGNSLPIWDINIDNIKAYVDKAIAASKDPKISAFNIATAYRINNEETRQDGVANFYDVDYAYMKRVISEIAKASAKEKINILNKAYMYITAIDEPQYAGTYPLAKWVNSKIIAMRETVADELIASGAIVKGSDIETTIRKIPLIITTPRSQLLGEIDSWCPTVEHFNNADERSYYQKTGNSNWWYTCADPINPFPTSHLDDNLISMRIMPWMAMEYKINGWLHWSFNQYTKFTLPNYEMGSRNPYDDPMAFTRAAGDGFFVYPGVNYGIRGPVSSLRLEAIRDGFEDYEYLWQLRDLLQSISKEYGTKVDFEELMTTLGSQIYSGTIPKIDDKALKNARRQVAGMIELLASNAKVYVQIKNIDIKQKLANVIIFSKENTQVKADGKIITANGFKHSVQVPLDKIENFINLEFTKDSVTKSAKIYIANGVKLVADYELEADIATTDITNRAKKRFMMQGEKKYLEVEIRNSPSGSVNDRYGVIFKKDKLFSDINIANVKQMNVNVYNNSNTQISLYLDAVVAGEYVEIDALSVKSGWNSFVINLKNKKIADATEFVLYNFNDKTTKTYSFGVDDISFILG